MSIITDGPRRGLGLISVVSVGAVSALAAATLGSLPAVATETGNVPTTASRNHHRNAAHVPSGIKSAGSLGLGTQTSGPGSGPENGAGSGSEKLDRSLVGAKGAVDVMIELDPAPASRAFAETARVRGISAARVAARGQTAAIKAAQSAVEASLVKPATKALQLYRAHSVYSGVAVRTDARRLSALAALAGVKAIHLITPKSPTNTSSAPLIGAPSIWQGRGETGQGVRVAVIDTGIDYTHADFGGAGTTGAYTSAKASSTFAPTAKVVGGYDFAGDAYNSDPSDPGYSPDPAPDRNPLDCDGHGSHVAGTTGGYGVTAAGDTYTGGYASDIDPEALRIGPGVAPGAQLYALKVFGCNGSTSLVGQALDWAADPNGDGDVADHLDVVNMSLGSDYGSASDPDAVASNNLAALGTVVVASMGNSGDVYEVGGSPGNASRVVGVAASDDSSSILDGLKIDAPAGIEPVSTVDGTQDDVFAAMKAVAYDWATLPGVTNTQVVEVGDWSEPETAANNIDGCSAYSTADATAIAGKIVLQKWLAGTGRRCASALRAANASTAGAVGVIYGSDVNSFSAGVTGDEDIPAMITVNQATTAIRAQLEAATPVAVRATMTNALRNGVSITDTGAVDQLAGFSSRGVGIAGGLKPDVDAPGVTTFSVASGSGDEGVAESGTSMASPHVAGEAALVRGAHTGYSVEEVKAAIMNTATQDLFVGPGHTGNVFGPERVGSGRVKADQAVATTTLAYVKDNPGSVSVSFGPVAVTAATTRLTKTVRVVNKRPTGSASYTIAYEAAHPTPGVTYTFSPSQVSVPARGSIDVVVTATVTRSALRRVQDPTTASDPLGIGLLRSYRTDASGRMVLTPAGVTTGHALRVPLWSAPRPASAMAAAPRTTVSGSTDIKTGSLALAGRPVSQGAGLTSYLSSLSTFQLQGTSPRIASCSSTRFTHCISLADDRSADLRYVGSASDAPVVPDLGLATLSFGVSSYGPWRTPASYTEFDVLMDMNADGTADAVVYNTRLATTDDYDHFLAELVDLRPGPDFGAVLDLQLVDAIDGSFDTNVFNSDSLTLPVSVEALQASDLVADETSKVRYWVKSYTIEAGQVDAVGSPSAPMTVSVGSPALAAYGGFLTMLNDDLPGATLAVRRDDESQASDKPKGLLLIHHLNTDGARAQVVSVKAVSRTRLTSNDSNYRYGGKPRFTATVSPSVATGTVSFKDNGRVVKTVRVTGGKAVWRATGQSRRRHAMTAVYTGDSATLPSTSAVVNVTVRGLATRTALAASDRDYPYRFRPRLTASLLPSRASGTVTFRDRSKIVGRAVVAHGKARLQLRVLSRGRHAITATYNGSRIYKPARSHALRVTVR